MKQFECIHVTSCTAQTVHCVYLAYMLLIWLAVFHTSNSPKCMSTLCLLAILDMYHLLDTNKSLRGSSRLMTPTKVCAICELRLPFTISYVRNIAVKCRARCLPNDLFFSPPRSRLIPLYGRKWGASDICSKTEAQRASLPFSLFFRRCKTQQTSERQSWDKIWTPKSNYKRQMTLISHRVWQLLSTCGETAGGPHNPSVSLSLSCSVSHVSLQRNARGPWYVASSTQNTWWSTGLFLSQKTRGVIVWQFLNYCRFSPNPFITLFASVVLCYLCCVYLFVFWICDFWVLWGFFCSLALAFG